MATPRKIVFSMPALLPEGGPGRRGAPGREDTASAPSPEPAAGGEVADVRKLAMLMEVSQALTGTLNLAAGLYGVLEVLERRCGAVRAAVTLLEEESGLLAIEASLGYSPGRSRVRYRVGEGVTGAVAESGVPAVVPKVSREPRFLHRAADRAQRTHETTFLCVPIVLDRATAGTLGIELIWHPEREPERWVKALRIAAAMISQALRIQRLIDLERRKLVEENTQLRQELRERYEFTHLIGNSGPMRRVFDQVAQVVGTGATVLIRGESGTGKELIAHALHHH
ncbi:MAG TPA: GAF domain-containing protein, partial [Gemmatimonadales bacterium]|nr:GAF domain-containing protein [Gemmatimonadales bacterium]